MMCSDVTLCSWNSPAPSAGDAGFYLCTSVSTKMSWPKPGWLFLGLMQQRVYIVQVTCPRLYRTPHDPSISQNVIDNAVGRWRKRLRASVKAKGHRRTTAEQKPALFRPNTLHNRLVSESPTVYQDCWWLTRYTLFRVQSRAGTGQRELVGMGTVASGRCSHPTSSRIHSTRSRDKCSRFHPVPHI